MRVDAYNAINQLYQQPKSKKPTSTKETTASDQLEISQSAKDYQIARKAVAESQDVRMDKVNDIKSRMASGTYNVTTKEVADQMTEKYFNSLF